MNKALFVCLGNICRSPIAEAVFIQELKNRGIREEWEVDSAATAGFHVGALPEIRARETMKKFGLKYSNRARQVEESDFHDFDYIFGMDENNISNLKAEAPEGCKAKILLLGDFDPQGERIIRDPYYDTGSKGFENCYHQCVRCCKGFLDQL